MSSRPNVLLAIFDSISASQLEAQIKSLPALHALRNKSVAFTNAYVCSPESSPARASLFTGLDMAAHRVWSDGVVLPEREKLLSEHFAGNGYQTWLIGRRQLAGISNWTTEHARLREYHHIDWAHGPLHRSRQNAYLTWLAQSATEIYNQIFPVQPNPDDTRIPLWQQQAMADLPDEYSFNAWVAQQFCQRIQEHNNGRPFLGVAGFVVGETMGAPVSGSLCIEALNEKALHQADTALATILDNLPDNTIVVVTTGRGNVAQNGLQHCMHNEAIKVPLMISSPDWTGSTIEGAVSTMDIAPTLFNATQMSMPNRIQGNCLLTTSPRGWALSRLRSPYLPNQSTLCTQAWKLVTTHSDKLKDVTQSYQLYDLTADAAETNDLANVTTQKGQLEAMIDLMIDARVGLEDRTEPRIAKF